MEQWLEERGAICLLVAGFLYGLNIPCPLGILLMAAGGLAREGVLAWPAVMLASPACAAGSRRPPASKSICTSTMGMEGLSTRNTWAPLGCVQCWIGRAARAF